MQSYSLVFDGYATTVNALPDYKGIYIAYTYNKTTGNLTELVYIGKADQQTLKQRISQHVNSGDLSSLAKAGEEICYAYAKVDARQIDVIENGLVYMQEPRGNTQLKKSFVQQPSEFEITGNCWGLNHMHFCILSDGSIYSL